jgi:hypothetical protein
VSPWLITTTGWPGQFIRLTLTVVRLVAQPVPVAVASAAAALLLSVALIRLMRRSTS